MLTDFARDQAFTIAWFGLMSMVWFGWAQEDPPRSWRWRLAVGSVIGVAFAGVFGYGMFARWSEASALEGRYQWFGVLVAIEVIAAGLGCLYLARRGSGRWMAWWVALVVAVHFVPLALLLDDASLTVVSVVQVAGLLAVTSQLRGSNQATSRLAGPIMGGTLLVFAAISAVMFSIKEGSPW